jgi:hypothetical protein
MGCERLEWVLLSDMHYAPMNLHVLFRRFHNKCFEMLSTNLRTSRNPTIKILLYIHSREVSTSNKFDINFTVYEIYKITSMSISLAVSRNLLHYSRISKKIQEGGLKTT